MKCSRTPSLISGKAGSTSRATSLVSMFEHVLCELYKRCVARCHRCSSFFSCPCTCGVETFRILLTSFNTAFNSKIHHNANQSSAQKSSSRASSKKKNTSAPRSVFTTSSEKKPARLPKPFFGRFRRADDQHGSCFQTNNGS